MSLTNTRQLALALGLMTAAVLGVGTAHGQDDAGYRIEVEIDGHEDSLVFLGNYFMDKQYLVDTAEVVDGKAVFAGAEPLPQGTYLLVLPPNNDYAQLHLEDDQHFALKTRVGSLTESMRVKGDEANERFFAYLQLLGTLRPAADSLRAVARDSTLPQATRDAAQAEVERIDAQVQAQQAAVKREAPNSILAAVLRSMEEPEMPDFEGTEEEVQRQRYLFYKRHYFDNVDLADPRALRSSYLAQRIEYYLDKLVVPAPDSIAREVDMILTRMRPAEESFRFYTSKFLNDYAASKIVGMDAVYAYLGEKYYVGGLATWADSATVAKIAENVAKLKPLLIGQPAPTLTLQSRDATPIDLYELDADFTVLFFYDPECGHCKKQTPFVVDFAEAYRDRGVRVVSVCSKFAPNQQDCWDYVDEKDGMSEHVLNAVDPYHRSKFKVRYDISSTPQIYVLDRDKRIVSKRIGAEQLGEVVDRLIAMREAEQVDEAASSSGR